MPAAGGRLMRWKRHARALLHFNDDGFSLYWRLCGHNADNLVRTWGHRIGVVVATVPYDFEFPGFSRSDSFTPRNRAEKHFLRPAPDFLSGLLIRYGEVVTLRGVEMEWQ